MDIIHYSIVLIIICIIAYFQFRIYTKATKKIENFKSIFPSDSNVFHTIKVAEVLDDNNSYSINNVTQIIFDSDNDILFKIISSINSYLKKNKGAASDFHLIKDVVERSCDSEEEEIIELQPMPLYLGLMGTMLGIIIGIGFLVFTGGLASLIDGDSVVDKSQGSIYTLMGAIAAAMIASFSGILLTTIISWKAKDAKGIHENSKNTFYSWIQSELLPILSGNTSNAIFTLQSNLQLFNRTFSDNLSKMDNVLSTVNSSYSEQIELIKLIDEIDVKQISKANINVLKELQLSITQIEQFNKYLHHTTEYVNKINLLNDNINKHLDRTEAIEKMGEFFQSEISQIEQRKVYLSEVVADVDQSLKASIEHIKVQTEKSLNDILSYSVENGDRVRKAIKEQDELFEKRLLEGGEFLNHIKNLSTVKESIVSLSNETQVHNSKLDKISDLLEILIETTAKNIEKPISDIQHLKLNMLTRVERYSIIATIILIILLIGAQTFIVTKYLYL